MIRVMSVWYRVSVYGVAIKVDVHVDVPSGILRGARVQCINKL